MSAANSIGGAGMKPSTDAIHFVHCILLTVVLTLFLTACGKIAWKEQVQLDSGEVVLFDRTAKAKSMGEWGGPGGWSASEMTLDIDKSVANLQIPQWRFPFVPILIDRDPATKEWFVVATFYDCQSWYGLGRPKLPYVEYQIRNGNWQVVPLEEKLIGHAANLLTGISSGGEPDLVSLSDKKEREKESAKKYRQVLAVWKTTC
jgi:hypothetical protein